jgi:hypothetical protein
MDDWNFEDQTDQYNGGDTSTGNDYNGYTPGYDNTNLDTGNAGSDYNGYTPGYNNPNLDTGGVTQPSATPDWFTGNPNVMGNTGAPMTSSNGSSVGGSIQQALAGLFSGGNGTKLATTGISALLEGIQNKQKAAAAQKMATNPALDPFGSQRQFYQTQAQNAVTNPYDSPIVKAQITQLQNAQNIKDAAAGRRSNSLTSSPAVMAQMAQIAQNYQNQMAQQGGSNLAPNSGLAQILQSGSNSGINGYISPLTNAVGNTTQTSQNSDVLEALKKFLSSNS